MLKNFFVIDFLLDIIKGLTVHKLRVEINKKEGATKITPSHKLDNSYAYHSTGPGLLSDAAESEGLCRLILSDTTNSFCPSIDRKCPVIHI